MPPVSRLQMQILKMDLKREVTARELYIQLRMYFQSIVENEDKKK